MKRGDFVKVYRVMVYGVHFDSDDKSFDSCSEEILDSPLPENWTDDIWKGLAYFEKVSKDRNREEYFGYDDILIQLQYGEINIPSFESNFDIDFDLNDDTVQECIPYELNYGWENIHELYIEVK